MEETNNMSIELKSWKIVFVSHQYSDSSPVSISFKYITAMMRTVTRVKFVH